MFFVFFLLYIYIYICMNWEIYLPGIVEVNWNFQSQTTTQNPHNHQIRHNAIMQPTKSEIQTSRNQTLEPICFPNPQFAISPPWPPSQYHTKLIQPQVPLSKTPSKSYRIALYLYRFGRHGNEDNGSRLKWKGNFLGLKKITENILAYLSINRDLWAVPFLLANSIS